MSELQNVGGWDRRGRAALAVVFTVLALAWLGTGRWKRGVLAVVVAAGLGFNAVTCFCGLNAALGIDTTDD